MRMSVVKIGFAHVDGGHQKKDAPEQEEVGVWQRSWPCLAKHSGRSALCQKADGQDSGQDPTTTITLYLNSKAHIRKCAVLYWTRSRALYG